MTKHFVAILMGSESDLSTMEVTFRQLKALKVEFEANILSAHRTPEDTVAYVKDAEKRGCHVFIAAAGLSAHLAGTIAAHTVKPVIGVPMAAESLNGLDALLSTAQMPGGIPVACVTIGSAGAKNAAILAAEILALHDADLHKRLVAERNQKYESLKKANQALQDKLR